jgi:hypothetical protein
MKCKSIFKKCFVKPTLKIESIKYTEKQQEMLSTLNALSIQKLYTHKNHVGFLIHWEFCASLIKKWNRNRESDESRVAEIVAAHKNGIYFPLILHVAELQEEGLVCYDGNHRREALYMIGRPDIPIILDVMFEAKQQDIMDAFNNINKSIQVPAIYFDEKEDTAPVKDDILALVRSYEIRYKQYISTSPRYHAPHFNRDAFVENLTELYNANNGTLSIQELGSLLERLNIEYSRGHICRTHSFYKSTVIEKCRKHGLWLFLERTIPAEHILILLKRKNE